DLAERSVGALAAAEKQLVVLQPLLVDAEDADMAGMVMPAGVDAPRNLELQFADLALPSGKALGNPLRDRDRTGVGKGAIVKAGTGDDVTDLVEIGGPQTSLVERLPDGIEIRL